MENTDSAIVGSVMSDTAVVEQDQLVFDKGTVPATLRKRIDAYAGAMGRGAKRTDVDNVIMAGDRQKDATDASGRIREGIGNPYGFIRRAIAIEDRGNKTIVKTERVSLDQAFSEFREGRIIQVGTSDDNANGLRPQFAKSLHYNIPVIDMSGKELWREGGASVGLKSAYVNLDTTVDLGADISFFSLNDAHVVVDAIVDSELVVEARLDGPFSKHLDKEVYRGSWPIGSVGPIPVTLGLTATVGCDINANGAATATTGVGMKVTLKGGVEYDSDKGTSPVWDTPRFDPRVIAPQVSVKGNTRTRCYVRPQVSIMLFDSAGPNVTPDIGARLDASTPPFKATVTGDLGLDVGGKLEIFGEKLGEVNYHLFTVEKQLWSTPN